MRKTLATCAVVAFGCSAMSYGLSAQVPARTGRIWGTVVDTRGQPLPDALIKVRGVTERGGENVGFSATSDENGEYSLDVAVGRYNITGLLELGYQGRTWSLHLHPTDNSNREVSTRSDVNKNFRLVLSGLRRPGHTGENFGSYYGGHASLSFSGSSLYSVAQPEAFVLEFTFTPTGPLIDQSRGQVLVFRETVKTFLGDPEFFDIPIAPYAVSGTIMYPNGARFQLLLRPSSLYQRYSDTWQTSVNLEFIPTTTEWATGNETISIIVNTDVLR